MVVDGNWTCCGDHFVVYTHHVIVLYTQNLYNNKKTESNHKEISDKLKLKGIPQDYLFVLSKILSSST